MHISIDKTTLDFVKSLEEERLRLTTNYFNFKPIDNKLYNGRYLDVNFIKKDNLCYIKKKGQNLWLYKEGFKPLQKGVFSKYKQPQVCWIEYIKESGFIIYRQVYYGAKFVQYLQYYPNKLKWVNTIDKATLFIYKQVEWNNYLSESKDGRESLFKNNRN